MAEQSAKKAPAKKSDKNKVGFFGRVSRFAKDLRSETKKVVWPSRKQVVNNTGIVLAVMAVVGAGIWIVDWIFAFLRGLLLGI